MRFSILGALISIILMASAHAEQRAVVHEGLMCLSPDALAKLTLHDGSARDPAGAAAVQGGCRPLAIGAILQIETARRNISVAIVFGNRYVVPNVDLGPVTQSRCVGPDQVISVSGRISRERFQSEDHGAWTYWLLTLKTPLCIATESGGTLKVASAEIDARSAPPPDPLLAGQQRILSGILEENDIGEHATEARFVLKP